MSCVRKSTLSTRSVNLDRINIHVGITRCALSLAVPEHRANCARMTYYSDQEIRGAIVMELVLKERDFGIEQDGIWARELSHGDAMCYIFRIGRCP